MTALPDTPLKVVTVHTSRTIMLAELSALFERVPVRSDLGSYRNAVVRDNVLLKNSFAGREKTFLNLRQLYGFDDSQPLFAVLRALWEQSAAGRPLLALLAACAVDEVLLATAPVILGTKVKDGVTNERMAKQVAEVFPERYGPATLAAIGQRAASSWTQSGHVQGKVRKVRSRAQATPEAVALALLIGTLQGKRGHTLFGTRSAQLLDTSASEHDALAHAAAQRGYFKYRRLGDVAEVDFGAFLAAVRTGHV